MAISYIEKLQNEAMKSNQEKVTFSIRLSVKEDLILQEVAENFDYSRQELLHRLIVEQIINPWEIERENDAEKDRENNIEKEVKMDSSRKTAYFLLNTNKVNDIKDHNWMLTNHVAAAFEDGYKEKIRRIYKGDWVFLYESGKGIVAYGKSDGETKTTHHYLIDDKTYYQHLDEFRELQRPFKASEIKKLLERKIPFAQTLSAIANGEKLLKEILKQQTK